MIIINFQKLVLIPFLTILLYSMNSSAEDVDFYDPNNGMAPFSKTVRVGDILFLSGELGIVGRKIVEGGTGAETAQALKNIQATLAHHGLNSSDVVKCTLFLADMADFPQVNEEYTKVFQPPRPARSAMSVSGLAFNAGVEIECIAAFGESK